MTILEGHKLRVFLSTLRNDQLLWHVFNLPDGDETCCKSGRHGGIKLWLLPENYILPCDKKSSIYNLVMSSTSIDSSAATPSSYIEDRRASTNTSEVRMLNCMFKSTNVTGDGERYYSLKPIDYSGARECRRAASCYQHVKELQLERTAIHSTTLMPCKTTIEHATKARRRFNTASMPPCCSKLLQALQLSLRRNMLLPIYSRAQKKSAPCFLQSLPKPLMYDQVFDSLRVF